MSKPRQLSKAQLRDAARRQQAAATATVAYGPLTEVERADLAAARARLLALAAAAATLFDDFQALRRAIAAAHEAGPDVALERLPDLHAREAALTAREAALEAEGRPLQERIAVYERRQARHGGGAA